jgi:hypothetical protein
MATKIKRKAKPRRARAARSNASVKTIVNKISKLFNLPKESIQIVRPDGNKVRSDATVSRVRKLWT